MINPQNVPNLAVIEVQGDGDNVLFAVIAYSDRERLAVFKTVYEAQQFRDGFNVGVFYERKRLY